MLLRSSLLLLGLLACKPNDARAISYEVFIDVDSEEELYELLATGQISEPSFDALFFLIQTGVSLNEADRDQLYLLPNVDYADVDRIIAHRREVGHIDDLDELVKAHVLGADLARSIRAFVAKEPPQGSKPPPQALLRLRARWSGRYDRLPPPLALQARASALGGLDVGVAATVTRNQLGRARWDAARAGLMASPERARFDVPKLYVQWRSESWGIIVGTYRIGFGQRLTFDVTGQGTPNGFFGDYELRRDMQLTLACKRARGELAASPCPSSPVVYVTPDYAWTNRLTGAAWGLRHPLEKGGAIELYLWGSYQIDRISQYELVVVSRCPDPRQDGDPQCRAPPVFVTPADGVRESAGEARLASLRWAHAEGLVGARVRYAWGARRHLGLTGYGAVPRWMVPGAALDFQEGAAKPFGGPFGAVGADLAFGFGSQDFSVEVARSFDRQHGGGGGVGAILRSVTTLATTEVDFSARYYAAKYANPYARPTAARDELDGLRARDEAGVRLRATSRAGRRVTLRAWVDAWSRLTFKALRAALFARTDLELGRSWSLALWAAYRHGQGEQLSVATALAYRLQPRLTMSAQLQHGFAAEGRNRRRHELVAATTLSARAHDRLRFRTRVRYASEDVSDNHHLSQTVWANAELAIEPRQRDSLTIRYDLRAFVDSRTSTELRQPNPEHWLSVEYVWRH